MKTILLLEDDSNLGALYQEELGGEGYHLLRIQQVLAAHESKGNA